jgi:hypothetical protein
MIYKYYIILFIVTYILEIKGHMFFKWHLNFLGLVLMI